MKKIRKFTWLLWLGLGWAIGKRTPGSDITAPGSDPVMCSDGFVEEAFICSMHPSVRSANNGNCGICGMPLVRKEEVRNSDRSCVKLSRDAIALAEIRTSKLLTGSKDNPRRLHLQGFVAPDESRVYTQVANLPGRIEKLYVSKTGEMVRKGQPIASIYSRDLIAALETFIYNAKSESIIRSTYNNLRSWGITEDQLKQFDLTGNYRKPIDIFADADGIVLEKKVNEGDQAASTYMGRPTALFTLCDLSVVWVVFDLREKDLEDVQTGQKIEIRVPAFNGRHFAGTLTYIGPAVDRTNGTIPVRAEVTNPDFLLKPGMLADGEILVAGSDKDLLIPNSALLWTGERSIVYVRKQETEEPVFEVREVMVEEGPEGYHKVLSGLEPDDQVVVNGTFTLDAAAQLAGANSMMNRSGRAVFRATEVSATNR